MKVKDSTETRSDTLSELYDSLSKENEAMESKAKTSSACFNGYKYFDEYSLKYYGHSKKPIALISKTDSSLVIKNTNRIIAFTKFRQFWVCHYNFHLEGLYHDLDKNGDTPQPISVYRIVLKNMIVDLVHDIKYDYNYICFKRKDNVVVFYDIKVDDSRNQYDEMLYYYDIYKKNINNLENEYNDYRKKQKILMSIFIRSENVSTITYKCKEEKIEYLYDKRSYNKDLIHFAFVGARKLYF